jgi:hypothetical protein
LEFFLENMHHFYTEIRTRKIHVLDPFMRYARSSYDKHLVAYAKAVIRRPFGKLMVNKLYNNYFINNYFFIKIYYNYDNYNFFYI